MEYDVRKSIFSSFFYFFIFWYYVIMYISTYEVECTEMYNINFIIKGLLQHR